MYQGHGSDRGQRGDEADSFGFQMVQNVDQISTELYFGFRHYDGFRKDTDFEQINAVMSGARVKF